MQTGSLLGKYFLFVKEQFPTEVAEKRPKLVPQLRAARDAGNRAWLSYLTLYIDMKPVLCQIFGLKIIS
jgi:hypothetical protein